ncbi:MULTISPECIES: alpha/beta fold hydrolase [unclassified Achromobacter]|uniref:alpha/beta fold hydrolase n=1 Tax=unclassified Achromobacter TaxID=2626865 RepID=UPI0018EA134D|nr:MULTISPECIES: alpha/beta fold hydrolase [unclassified Achromobacter]
MTRNPTAAIGLPSSPSRPSQRHTRVVAGRPLMALVARALAALAVVLLAGCAASFQPQGAAVRAPAIDGPDSVQGSVQGTPLALATPDDARLPMRAWMPFRQQPWAVIVALHGMNDYSNAFDMPAQYWAYYGIATYAYDQRGFGASARPGIWSDTDTMVADLNAAVAAAHARHPGVPVYVLGESMGGAVVAAALRSGPAGKEPPLAREISGAILSAPATWGRGSMNPFFSLTLWLGYQTFPAMHVSPPRALKIVPSDNIPMLIQLGGDPLVIKRTRIDTLKGLVDLMSAGEDAIDHLPPGLPTLVMFGQHEQVLPKDLVTATVKRLREHEATARLRIALYPDGYHMLLRDLHAETVWRDVMTWMRSPTAALPSGAEQPPTNLAKIGSDR